MSGRRKYRPHVRDVSALPVLATAGWGASWGHVAGFLFLLGVALVFWPVVMLALMSAPGALPGCLVPRSWRVRHRKRRIDAGLGRGRSGYMPSWFRRAIRRADRGRCAHCGYELDLQWDHIVPWACGGLTVLWNVAILCQRCNGVKSCYYPKWDGYGPRFQAPLAIWRSERRARYNPLRWVRLAWSL